MLSPLKSWSSELTLATFHNNTYAGSLRGRTMQKSADDLDRYQAIIDQVKPDVVIETGTRYGGSALWFRDRVGMVISIDLEPQMSPPMYAAHEKNTWFIQGNSVDPKIVSQVRSIIPMGATVMVSLDSDHHANHVWQEITLYGPLVTRGQALVVEDACFDMWTGEDARRGGRRIPEEGGTLKALNLAGIEVDPRYERATEIEEMTDVSHSPCGYWWKS